MFSWFVGKEIKTAAQSLHEIFCMALKCKELHGEPKRFFIAYPFIVDHQTVSYDEPMHRFVIGPEVLLSFVFTATDKADKARNFVSVEGVRQFDGLYMQASTPGQYIVRLSPPLARPVGKSTMPLLRHFVSSYDAADVTDPLDLRRFKANHYVR